MSVTVLYERAGAPERALMANVLRLTDQPGVLAGNLRRENVVVGGTAVVIVYGDLGPQGVVPNGAVVDREALAHRMRAVFELSTAAVVIYADDRYVSRPELEALISEWVTTAH